MQIALFSYRFHSNIYNYKNSHRIHRIHRTFCYRHLCKSVKSVGVFLSRKFCGFCEFCGRLSLRVRGYGKDAIPSYNTLLQYICGKRKIISLTRHSG